MPYNVGPFPTLTFLSTFLAYMCTRCTMPICSSSPGFCSWPKIFMTTCSVVCQFLLEEVFCKYGYVRQVIADQGELDSDKAREIFMKDGVHLTLTTTYNLEANGKIKRGHRPIVKALAKAFNGRVKDRRRCSRMHCGRIV